MARQQSLVELLEWHALREHYETMREVTLRDLFAEDPARGSRLTAEGAGIYLDYSKHRVNDETLARLLALARARGLGERIEAMFRGEVVNTTEQRPALHIALRAPRDESILVAGHDIVPDVHRVLSHMAAFADQVRAREWLGYTGRPVVNVVNIGIGGSDLGPRMASQALRGFADRGLTLRFVSNVDATDFEEATRDLDPAETLFIVASKSFTTLETMTNARLAREWCLATLRDERAVSRHFVAVSTNIREVERFGIDPANTFEFWDWVGGRYSMCSAIGLPVMVALGPAQFGELLAGAHEMDRHFRTTPFERNLPVIMGLIGVWYADCFGAQTVGVMPYEQYLEHFPAYLQQLTMESNGKRTTSDGGAVKYATGPVYWGEPGTNGQHSFFQLLHQGTHLVPCDLIGFSRALHAPDSQHDLLIANMLAQAEALAFGGAAGDATSEAHRVSPGNRPTSVLLADQLTPRTLGALVALYEHVVFTQAAIWDINPFDQWGVELGKELASRIAPELGGEVAGSHDSSTAALIVRYRATRRRAREAGLPVGNRPETSRSVR